MFFDYLQYLHDTNLTLTSILLTILQVSRSGKLPRRLLIQMDNFVRENKNKFVFGFFAYLVEAKIFHEVRSTLQIRPPLCDSGHLKSILFLRLFKHATPHTRIMQSLFYVVPMKRHSIPLEGCSLTNKPFSQDSVHVYFATFGYRPWLQKEQRL